MEAKALSSCVERIMSTDVLVTDPGTSVADVAETMCDRAVGCCVVVSPTGELLGMFTERDLLSRVVGAGLVPAATEVGSVMTPDVKVLAGDVSIGDASDFINEQGFRHVPVVIEGRVAGIVSIRDVLRVRMRQMEAQLDDELHHLKELRSSLDLSSDERSRQLMQVNEHLRNLALTDELTGLFNHRYLTRRLPQEVARAERLRAPLSLLFVDIDHFKVVNDRWGHPIGDEVLSHVADVLRNTIEGASVVARIRRSDIVARFGGEEFVIMLPDTSTDGGEIVAERIRLAVANSPTVLTDGTEIEITVSVGVAGLSEASHDAEALMRVADEALYLAKASGRNRIVRAKTTTLLKQGHP